jgi:hypothetical protein
MTNGMLKTTTPNLLDRPPPGLSAEVALEEENRESAKPGGRLFKN